MIRRTLSLPKSTEKLVRQLALDGESFSATVARLIEAGAASLQGGKPLSDIGSERLRRKAADYLGAPVETPGGWQLVVDEARYREAIEDLDP